ncbi:MAG: M55 family metallopeptidase [Thermoanaerobaculia bacterium]
MRLSRLIVGVTVVLVGFAIGGARAAADLKVYISADLEGVAGAVTPEQLGPDGFEYSRFRELMTAEVLAAIEGARAAGATEILVSDSHGNGQNLLLERFPEEITIIRSWPRPLMMMEGIDSSFDAAVFIGYHAATTTAAGVRAHTLSSARLAAVELNGKPMSEAGLNAAIAGHFGVPVVMISGDDVTVEETRRLLGRVEGAAVKRAISFHSAATMTPQAAQKLIREKVEAGLDSLGQFEPYVLTPPIHLDVTFKNYRPAELLAYLSSVERTTAHSIRFTGEDMVEIFKFLEFMLSYRADLEP